MDQTNRADATVLNMEWFRPRGIQFPGQLREEVMYTNQTENAIIGFMKKIHPQTPVISRVGCLVMVTVAAPKVV